MKFKPVRGTKDFLPEEMIRREYVIKKIKKVFESYGFDEMQTPVLESFKVLGIKGGLGEEVKKQIFYFKDKAGRELGLRPELTIGMARVVASNPQLQKPLKRYCIAPCWRYEEVSKGRKREFWQADIDIVGSYSMDADVECIACAVDSLRALGLKDFLVVLNNRKILDGLLELANIPRKKNYKIFRVIDKLDRIGKKNVKYELKKIGLNEKQIKKLLKLITIKGECEEVLERAKTLLKGIEIAEEGLKELEEILEKSKFYNFTKILIIDFSLVRGLDYYTGPIFEIKIKKREIGSIAGGGRYDNLIELLGGRKTPATGISLGIERIIEIMKKEKMFYLPSTKTLVFVACVKEKLKKYAIKISKVLRKNGLPTQIDLMGRSLKKQLEFVDRKKIPFVVIVGEKEVKTKKFRLKNMMTGRESSLSLEKIVNKLKKLENLY